MTEPKSEKQAEMLRRSSFSTMSDVQRFIQWYDETRHHSAWDDYRYSEATEIVNAAG